MKRLLVKQGMKDKASEALKLLSDSNNDYISYTLDRRSNYIYDNIDKLNELLLLDNERDDDYSFRKEYEKIGIKIADYYDNDGNHIVRVGYDKRLIEICREYVFIFVPRDEEEEINEFALIPTYIFPQEFYDYDILKKLMPDVVNILLDNGIAYVSEEKSI